MAFVLSDRTKETTTTTGTGTYSLAGAATGFQGFVAGVGDGNTTYYSVSDGINWEVGIGTVTDASPDTLSRDTILASSNGGEAVNWGAGTKDIWCTIPAGRSGGVDLLSTTTISGTPVAVEFTTAAWFSGVYRMLELRLFNVALTDDNDGVDLFFRAASSYLTSGYAGAVFTSSGGTVTAPAATTARALLTNRNGMGNAGGEELTGRIFVYDPGLAGVQKVMEFCVKYASITGVAVSENGHYFNSGTAALDGLKLQVVTSGSNTFADGVVELWGHR